MSLLIRQVGGKFSGQRGASSLDISGRKDVRWKGRGQMGGTLVARIEKRNAKSLKQTWVRTAF